MNNIRLITALFSCLFFSTLLSATDFPVATVTQLHTAADNASPGDTVTMLNGTWMNADITFDANGTAGNPVVLRAETPGGVIISGNVRFRIGGDYLIVTGLTFKDCVATESNLISFRRSSTDLSSYSRLTETVVIDCNPADPTEDYKWIGIFGDHNEVDHCYIANKTHQGATLVVWSTEDEGNHHIHHNFFGPRPEGTGNGFETIRIGTSSFAQFNGSNLVEHNYFYQTDGEIEIISGKSSYCTYRYNIFKDCKGGLTLRHGTNCLVEGNIFFGEEKSGSYGVRVIDRDHTVINNYFQGLAGTGGLRYPITIMSADATPAASGYQHAINITVAYNTIVDCTRGIMIGADSRPFAPDDCLLVNNVVTVDGDPPVIHNNAPTNTTYSDNYFHRVDGGVAVPTSGFVDVDPELVLAAGDSIFRPTASSPIVGAAEPAWLTNSIDFEAQARPAAPTIGADEISATQAIDRGVFGPTWLLADVSLPVDLLSFSVARASKCAKLNWSVENEHALAKYVVMRSVDGRSFAPIGHEEAASTQGTHNYTFTDCNLPQTTDGKVYYRLQMLDFDGTFRWSEILTQTVTPAANRVEFTTTQDGRQFMLHYPTSVAAPTAAYTVISIDGRTLVSGQHLKAGERVLLGENFRPGVYVVTCRYANGEFETFKWQKG